MKRSQAYPSSYLAQDDVREGPIRATIQDVRIETIGQGERAVEKPIVHFREKGLKSFVLNQTNWQTIEEAYGPESDAWASKPIELYFDPGIKFGLELVGGVRVRIPSGAAALAMEDAVALALKAGMTREEFVAALKAKGLKGYNAAKDSGVARQVLAEAQVEADKVDNTIPF